jgi:hypothetical protein
MCTIMSVFEQPIVMHTSDSAEEHLLIQQEIGNVSTCARRFQYQPNIRKLPVLSWNLARAPYMYFFAYFPYVRKLFSLQEDISIVLNSDKLAEYEFSILH